MRRRGPAVQGSHHEPRRWQTTERAGPACAAARSWLRHSRRLVSAAAGRDPRVPREWVFRSPAAGPTLAGMPHRLYVVGRPIPGIRSLPMPYGPDLLVDYEFDLVVALPDPSPEEIHAVTASVSE